MADANTQNLRILKIKTGVVKRLMKDKQSYEKEAQDQEKKIEGFRAEGKDEYFLRQQINSLKETQLMIPDVVRRLQAAYDDLKGVTSGEEIAEGIRESEEYKLAIKILEEAEACLNGDKKSEEPAEEPTTEEVAAN